MLTLIAVVLSASPQVGPEVTFADTVTTPLAGYQFGATVSNDGSALLVVGAGTSGLFLRRFDFAGNPIDVDATHIEAYASVNGGTAVVGAAFNGTNHLVLWRDFTNLRMLRVSPERVPLSTTPTRLSSTANGRFAVASDGTDWFVVWQEFTFGSTSIRGARVTASGGISTFWIASSSLDGEARTAPAVAWNGTHFLVVWLHQKPGIGTTEVVAQRFTVTGTPVDVVSSSVTPGRTASAPGVGANGATWLVAFLENRGTTGLYASRISSAGAVVDPAGLSLGVADFASDPPVVAGNGTEWLIAWEAYSAGRVGRSVRVNASVALVGPPVQFGPGSNLTNEWLIATASGFALAGTTQAIVSDPQATLWAFSTTGAIANPEGTDIVGGPNSESPNSLLTFGGRYTAFSQDNRAVPGMYANQLDTTGVRLAGGPVYVMPHNSSGWPPVAESNTLGLLLTGCSVFGGTVAVQRVSASLAVLDAAPISTGLSGLCRAGSNGTDFLVAAGYTNLEGRFFTSTGAPSGATFQISAAAGEQYPAGVAFGASTWLVVWTDSRQGQNDVYAARVNTAGSVLDPTGIAIATDVSSQTAYDVTFGGGVFLVRYTEGPWALLARRVDPSGAVLDSTPIVVTATGPLGALPASAVVWQGNHFYQVWNAGTAVMGQGLLPDGTMIPATPSTLVTTATTGAPALASAVPNQALLSYSVTLDGGFGGALTYRKTFARLLSFGVATPGQTCSLDDNCAAGTCVDGVCCRTTCGAGAVDCQQCNLSGNGTCTPLDAGVICRLDAGVCDVVDTCDGVSGTCTNRYLASTVVCRPAAGVCDRTENCSGAGPACPADLFFTTTTTCRAAAGPCDRAETCSGTSASCGVDLMRDAGTVCDAGTNTCDPDDVCDGLSATCAPVVLSGVACADGDQCTAGELCVAGACVGGMPITCLPPSQCVFATGCSSDAGCLFASVDAGTTCDGGLCDAFGACVGAAGGGSAGGGSAGGGSAAGGSAAGGSAGGGSAAGGSAAGGSAAGGSAAGGSAAGGSAAGGSAAGGSAAGGSAAGGSAAGGPAAGGSAAGGSAAGGSAAGGSAAGGSAAGGSAAGGSAAGGSAIAGGEAGGTAGGSTDPTPPKGCGCSSSSALFALGLVFFLRRRHRRHA